MVAFAAAVVAVAAVPVAVLAATLVAGVAAAVVAPALLVSPTAGAGAVAVAACLLLAQGQPPVPAELQEALAAQHLTHHLAPVTSASLKALGNLKVLAAALGALALGRRAQLRHALRQAHDPPSVRRAHVGYLVVSLLYLSVYSLFGMAFCRPCSAAQLIPPS